MWYSSKALSLNPSTINKNLAVNLMFYLFLVNEATEESKFASPALQKQPKQASTMHVLQGGLDLWVVLINLSTCGRGPQILHQTSLSPVGMWQGEAHPR
jgi:hypothetical protein